MTALNRWLLAGTLALPLVPARAQAPAQSAPIIHNTFASDEEGWTTIAVAGSTNAKVAVVRDAASARDGKPSLQYTYNVAKGEFGLMMLPTPGGKLAGAKTIRFWVKSPEATTLAVMAQEEGGARYALPFAVPADKWQQVELPVSDFVLSTGKDDPPDADGKLDLDQVQGLGMADLAQFFAQMGDTPAAVLFPHKTGEHSFLLNDFVVSSQPTPSSIVVTPLAVTLDSFKLPQVSWVAIGGAKVTLVDGGPIGGPSFSLTYHAGPTSGGGAMKSLPRGVFAKATKIEFDAASSKPTKLFVQVEQPNGGKFNTMVDLDGGQVRQHLSLTLDNFQPSQDSAPDAKLDLAQVNALLFGDLSGVIGGPEQDNTLWLGNLKAVK